MVFFFHRLYDKIKPIKLKLNHKKIKEVIKMKLHIKTEDFDHKMQAAGLGRVKFNRIINNINATIYYVNDIGYKLLIFTDSEEKLPSFKLFSNGENLEDGYFEGFTDAVAICKWFIEDYDYEALAEFLSKKDVISQIVECMSAVEYNFCKFIKGFEFPDIAETFSVKYWEVPHHVYGERSGGNYISFFRTKRENQNLISKSIIDKTILAFGLELTNRINDDNQITNWSDREVRGRLSIIEPYLKGENQNFYIEDGDVIKFESR